jgi:hypothetical protein
VASVREGALINVPNGVKPGSKFAIRSQGANPALVDDFKLIMFFISEVKLADGTDWRANTDDLTTIYQENLDVDFSKSASHRKFAVLAFFDEVVLVSRQNAAALIYLQLVINESESNQSRKEIVSKADAYFPAVVPHLNRRIPWDTSVGPAG